LFNVRDADGAVRAAAEAGMREVIGRTAIDQVLTEGKEQVQLEAQKLLQAILDRYGAGVEIVTVKLQDVDPPDQVSDAFKDVISAQQDKERLINEARGYANDVVPRARGQAAQTVNEAEAYRETKVREATGTAQRFTKQQEEYAKAKDVTRRRLYLETMESILPGANKIVMDDLAGKQAVPYLPLEAVAPAGGGAGAGAGRERGLGVARRWLALLGAIALLVAVWNLALFTVPQWMQAMVVQLGEPVRVVREPGLYWKIPFIQQVIYFDR